MHRDLKPANIFFVEIMLEGVNQKFLKIGDFGSARMEIPKEFNELKEENIKYIFKDDDIEKDDVISP